MAAVRCDASAAGCACILDMGHAGQHRAQGDVWGWWDGQIVNGKATRTESERRAFRDYVHENGGRLLSDTLNLSTAPKAELDKAAAIHGVKLRCGERWHGDQCGQDIGHDGPHVFASTTAKLGHVTGPVVMAKLPSTTEVNADGCVRAVIVNVAGPTAIRCDLRKGHEGHCNASWPAGVVAEAGSVTVSAETYTRGSGLGAPAASVGTEQCRGVFIRNGYPTLQCPMAKGHPGECAYTGPAPKPLPRQCGATAMGVGCTKPAGHDGAHADILSSFVWRDGQVINGCAGVTTPALNNITDGPGLGAVSEGDIRVKVSDLAAWSAAHARAVLGDSPKLWAVEQAEADAAAIAERNMRKAIAGPPGIEETRARLRAVLERNKRNAEPRPTAFPTIVGVVFDEVAPPIPRPGQTWRDQSGDTGTIYDIATTDPTCPPDIRLRMVSGLRVDVGPMRFSGWTFVSGPTAPETPREAFGRVLALELADRPEGVTERAWLVEVGRVREWFDDAYLCAMGLQSTALLRERIAERRDAMVAAERAER